MIVTDTRQKDSAICQRGLQPSKALGYIVSLLRLFFTDSRNISEPSIKQFVWTKDDDANQVITSKILITPIGRFDVNKLQQRPALIVKRRSVKTTVDSIGGVYHGNTALLGDLDADRYPIAGQQAFEYAKSGEIVVYCLSHEEAAATLLAEEVESLLLGFRQLIMKDLGLHEFMPNTLEESQRVEEASQHWCVPVVCQYDYRIQYILRPEAPLLKTIQFARQLEDGSTL